VKVKAEKTQLQSKAKAPEKTPEKPETWMNSQLLSICNEEWLQRTET